MFPFGTIVRVLWLVTLSRAGGEEPFPLIRYFRQTASTLFPSGSSRKAA
jgi:hypothetical protein